MVTVVRNNVQVEITLEDHLREILQDDMPSDTLQDLVDKYDQFIADFLAEQLAQETKTSEAIQSAKDIIQAVQTFSNTPYPNNTPTFTPENTAGMSNSEVVAYVNTLGNQLALTQTALYAVMQAVDSFGGGNLRRVLVEIHKQFNEDE